MKADRQGQQRERENHAVQAHLSGWAQAEGEKMRIEVARQEPRLEEDHTHVPDGGASTEYR